MEAEHLKRYLKLRQMVVLDTVLRERSLLKAAEVLSLTQPAITKTIQAMEEALGVELVERTARGIQPTVFGDAVHARLKNIFAEIRLLGDDLAGLAEGNRGHVVVGTLISAAAWLLPMAITRLNQAGGSIVVTIQEGTNDQLMPQLVTGEIDLVVGRIPYGVYPGVRHQRLYSETLCAVARVGHPEVDRRRTSMARLGGYPWIIPIVETPVRTTVERLFREAGLALPANRIESLSILTNVNVLRRSDAICLLPSAVADHYVREGMLAMLPMTLSETFGEVGISEATEREPTPAALALATALRQAAAERAREDDDPDGSYYPAE